MKDLRTPAVIVTSNGTVIDYELVSAFRSKHIWWSLFARFMTSVPSFEAWSSL